MISENSFVLKVLIGEKIKHSNDFLFRNKPTHNNTIDPGVKQYIDNQLSLIQSAVGSCKTSISNMQQTFANTQSRLTVIESDNKQLHAKIDNE